MVKFTAPPRVSGGRGESQHNKQIAQMLRESPGEWACISRNAKNDGLAVRIRNKRAKSFSKGIWEATSRINDDNTYDIYARYVGEEE